MEPPRRRVVSPCMRMFLVALVLLAGCHRSSTPLPAPVPDTPPPVSVPSFVDLQVELPPEPDEPPEPLDPCEGLDRVVVTAPNIELQCKDEHRSCDGTVIFSLRNCTESTVEFVEMQIRQGPGTLTFTPAESSVAPGAVWTKDYDVSRRGTHSVVAMLREGEELVSTDPVELRIDNPAREAALKACEACNGRWDTRGLLRTEGCNCSTTDAGKECRDGDDCESACMFDRFEVVRPGSRTCDADGSCVVQRELGRPVGRCSGSAMNFGCRARIQPGASTDPPVTLPWRAPVLCVE